MTYAEAGEILLKESGATVKKWRKSMSGKAFYEGKMIITPKPLSPTSFEIFAHEIGHIQANPDHRLPSWLRELQAIEYCEQQFIRFGFKIPSKVKQKMMWYGAYSICQALNRGMKRIPKEGNKYRHHMKICEKLILNDDGTITSKKVWRAK